MAEHLYTWVNPVRDSHIETICRVLENNGVIALPMDVAWAFVCDAANTKALEKIFRLKPSHPKNRPLSLVCSSISMAAKICSIDDQAYRWLKKSLPGPYTIILGRHVLLPKQINDKRREVGLRIPDDDLTAAIINKLGRPLAASTIPIKKHGDEPDFIGELPSFGSQVAQDWGHNLDMVVDLGLESPRLATTIIELTSGLPVLVRQGAGRIDVFGL